MASKYPPSFTNKDLGDLAKMAKVAAAKKPKSKPKPFNQQEADRQSKLNKQYTARASKNQAFEKAAGLKVDPMRYIGPAKPPVKGKMPKRGSMDNDLRSMNPKKLPAKTMPKQMGPKKAMKPKQMKRMGYK